jgi:hypothetical protein
MTASLTPGYRLFKGEDLNTAIDSAQGATGPTGPTGSTGSTGPTGPTGSAGAGTPVSAPANASSTGTAGQIAYDSGFIYVAVATNTWKRVAIATW